VLVVVERDNEKNKKHTIFSFSVDDDEESLKKFLLS